MTTKPKTKTVVVSCSLAQGRYRAGRFFAHGSSTYELTAEQLKAVQADPYLAAANPEDEAEAAARDLSAALGGMEAEALGDLLSDVAEAYNAKAEDGELSALAFEQMPRDMLKEYAERLTRWHNAKAKPQDRLSLTVGEAAKATEGAKDAKQAPAEGATPPKAAEGREGAKAGQESTPPQDEAAPLPEGLPHRDALKGLSTADVAGMVKAGTLAAHPGMTAAKAAEVAEALEAEAEAKAKGGAKTKAK